MPNVKALNQNSLTKVKVLKTKGKKSFRIQSLQIYSCKKMLPTVT